MDIRDAALDTLNRRIEIPPPPPAPLEPAFVLFPCPTLLPLRTFVPPPPDWEVGRPFFEGDTLDTPPVPFEGDGVGGTSNTSILILAILPSSLSLSAVDGRLACPCAYGCVAGAGAAGWEGWVDEVLTHNKRD